MAHVAVRNVAKRYGTDVVAVENFSLEVADGEFLVMVGPSGCGKTTILRCIAGLETFEQGEIEIDGRVVNRVAAKNRNIAMVFQNYALYPHMTVRANLAFGLKLGHVPKPEIERRVQDAAEILNLSQLLHRKPKELSGGQRQRVALGRAIVREPAVFLMDEPLSNLDAKLRVQTRAEIVRLRRRLGATIIYVTHDQVEAMTMGDRLAVMRDGLLQQVGTPRELYRYPANTFVAGFIGSPAMNFATFELGDGGLVLGSTKLPLPEADLDALRRSLSGSSVIVGFRPEHLRLVERDGSPADDGWRLGIAVDVVEYLGSGELIHSQLEGHEVLALVESERRFAVGQSVDLEIPTSRLHFFDAATSSRVSTESAAPSHGREREASAT